MITDAYIDGFCKAAEELGVDPELLMKQAVSLAGLGRVGRFATRALRKGQGAVQAGREAIQAQGGGFGGTMRAAGSGIKNGWNRYMELLGGGNKKVIDPIVTDVTGYTDGIVNRSNLASRYMRLVSQLPSDRVNYPNASKGFLNLAKRMRPAVREIQKARMAQGITAGVAGGLGLAGVGLTLPGQAPAPQSGQAPAPQPGQAPAPQPGQE